MIRAALLSLPVIALLFTAQAAAQRSCGNGELMSKLRTEDPASFSRMRAAHASLVAGAVATKDTSIKAKMAAQADIPVVFHFLLTQAEYNKLGGDAGIKSRVYTQISSLNGDFNGLNTDRTKVPGGFKSLFAAVGMQFAFAKGTSSYAIAPGIEVKIIGGGANYDVNNSCASVKLASTGLPPWDVARYLNIWVCNITGGGQGSQILGVTVPPSFVGQTVNGYVYKQSDLGVVLNYGAVGVRNTSDDYYIDYTDRGRTMTHEVGHYFELVHIWGDDGGDCPATGGYDDDIADTPPQADYTYCNAGSCPSFPKYDNCSKSGDGIMFMNYMDYVDDAAMYMFSPGQAVVMKDQIQSGKPSYSLTQNPGLSSLAVGGSVSLENAVNVWPNPSGGDFRISLGMQEAFTGAEVLNSFGQVITHITPHAGSTDYSVHMANAAAGVYFVKCHFENGAITKKILLQ